MDDHLSGWKTPFGEKESSWEAIQDRIKASDTPTVRMWPKLFAVAASVALVLGMVFMSAGPEARTETTMAQQHRTVTLPDGSTAKLNAASTITFDERWNQDRSITLDGEAFFEVKKGSRFQVITDNGIVEVLGTSFNVFSRDENFKVACKTGRVRVIADEHEVILTPDLATIKTDGGLRPQYSDTEHYAWVRGYFSFENEPLENVFEEIERQFGVTVDMQDIQEGRFTGEFSAEDLDTALRVICGPMHMDYHVEEAKVTITQSR